MTTARVLLAALSAVITGFVAPPVSAATLGDVLKQHGIPLQLARSEDLPLLVTSGFGDGLPETNVIAEYVDHGDNRLDGTFYLFRREAGSTIWHGAHLAWPEWPESDPLQGGKCAGGSILDVREAGTFTYVVGHASPSAGCTMVLDRDLKVVGYFYGWPSAVFKDGNAVYTASMVHFAATHPSRLWLFDPVTGHSRLIYPLKPYGSRRQAFIAEMKAAYERCCVIPSPCGGRFADEHQCDAEQFDDDVSEVKVSDEADALIFRAGWSNDVDQTGQDIVYIYRNLHSAEHVDFRELPFDEFADRFGPKLIAPTEPMLRALFEPH